MSNVLELLGFACLLGFAAAAALAWPPVLLLYCAAALLFAAYRSERRGR